MSAPPEPRPATWEDVVAAPAHMTAELIDGALHVQPRPRTRHGRVNKRILRALAEDDGLEDLPGWILDAEIELHLGQPDPRSLVVVPDISGWRAERVPDYPDLTAVEVVPGWVCEVLSPSNARYDRLVKMDLYARLGVPWAWLVDPEEELLEVYQLRQGLWVRVQAGGPEDERVLEPFGVKMSLGALFRR